MKSPTTAFATTSVPASPASANSKLHEFTHYHGMLCSPTTASRCCDAFQGGTILFMPSSYTRDTFQNYEYSGKGVLTPLSYYLLVLLSLTGLSTLLKQTVFRMATEIPQDQQEEANAASLTSQYNEHLQVDDYILEHCKQHTNATSLQLKRRFEYQFRLVGLDVVMLHFQCDQNKLHLVEVFHLNNPFWKTCLMPVMDLAIWIRRNVLMRGTKKAKKTA
ncbi:expressed unknown protein [Seminavis robusta]|uniref:Uncharacterized protein n=1 Tax=Seminavis robusta TaxID=568900 RepID=A0A9N8H586_9STRA|nr:expressed unknown protein [Seminavis robusta]|eukprot:Sro80_g043060.1 n/a (219) ;mRNA; f:52661-53317